MYFSGFGNGNLAVSVLSIPVMPITPLSPAGSSTNGKGAFLSFCFHSSPRLVLQYVYLD